MTLAEVTDWCKGAGRIQRYPVDARAHPRDGRRVPPKKITASKAASKFCAAVYVYEAADYNNMRLFLTADGKNGFAIKPDGDIISVFSAGSGNAHAMPALAAQAGGTKLDAFNSQSALFFQTNNCTGPAYLQSQGDGAVIAPTLVLGAVAGSQVLYVADNTVALQTSMFQSFLDASNVPCISQAPQSQSFMLPVAATLNLATLGPSPFRVVIQPERRLVHPRRQTARRARPSPRRSRRSRASSVTPAAEHVSARSAQIPEDIRAGCDSGPQFDPHSGHRPTRPRHEAATRRRDHGQ